MEINKFTLKEERKEFYNKLFDSPVSNYVKIASQDFILCMEDFILQIQKKHWSDCHDFYNIKEHFGKMFNFDTTEKQPIDLIRFEADKIWFMLCLFEFDILDLKNKYSGMNFNFPFTSVRPSHLTIDLLVKDDEFSNLRTCENESAYFYYQNGACGYSLYSCISNIFDRAILRFTLGYDFNKSNFMNLVEEEYELLKNSSLDEFKVKQINLSVLHNVKFYSHYVKLNGTENSIQEICNKKLFCFFTSANGADYYIDQEYGKEVFIKKGEMDIYRYNYSELLKEHVKYDEERIDYYSKLNTFKLAVHLVLEFKCPIFNVSEIQYFNSMSRSVPRIPQVNTEELPIYEITEGIYKKIFKYTDKIEKSDKINWQIIEHRISRTINTSISHNYDIIDKFIDLMIVWENLLGSKSSTSFKISACMSKIVSLYLIPDGEKEFNDYDKKIDAFYNEFKDIYTVRSDIMHGSKNIYDYFKNGITYHDWIDIDRLLIYTSILLKYILINEELYNEPNDARSKKIVLSTLEYIEL